MFDLLPSEHWDYGSADMGRGLVTAAFAPRHDALEGVALPGFGRCLPIRSARAAIVLALKVLALPARARVGVPLYCCPVVFKAIKAAGCSPRFIDIDPGTYCLSVPDLAAKSEELDAIVAVHMFGNLCDVPRLRDAARGKTSHRRLCTGPRVAAPRSAGWLARRGRCLQRSLWQVPLCWRRRGCLHPRGGSRDPAFGIRARSSRSGPGRRVPSRSRDVLAVSPSQQAALGPGGIPAVGHVTARR